MYGPQSWISARVTHHTSCLYGLRHAPSIGLTPEDVTVETMAASVHDEGKRVHVTPNAHERQEANTTLYQHILFILRTESQNSLGIKEITLISNLFKQLQTAAGLFKLNAVTSSHTRECVCELRFIARVSGLFSLAPGCKFVFFQHFSRVTHWNKQ